MRWKPVRLIEPPTLYCNSIIAPRANVDRRVQKTRPGLEPCISITQVVFVRTGHVNSDDTTTVFREERRNIANPFSSPGEPCACNRPLLRPGKAAVQGVDGSECHGLAPRHIVILRMLWAVPCE